MKAMKNKKNKKNKSQKAQQSFTERIAKAAGGFKERAKSMNSEEKAEQAQQPEQPETQAQQESGEAEVDVKALQAELEKAKAQSDEYLDLAQRKQAEFDNYRKRTLKEKMDLVQTGGRDVLLAMLPVRDDVQRAVDAMQKSDDIEALRAGVNLISQKFTETLRQKGVTEIDVKGREFDADLCEAVAKFAAGEDMQGKVVDVVQTGYMLGDKVLRFAKVVVGE